MQTSKPVIRSNRYLISSKDKLIDHKSRIKRRVSTYQSPQNSRQSTQQILSQSVDKRVATSQNNNRFRHSSFHKRSVDKQQSHSNMSRGAEVRQKLRKQQFRKVLSSQTEVKEEDQERTNPWGGQAIAKGIKQKNSSKDKLEEQRQSLQKLKKLKQEFSESKYLQCSLIKYKRKHLSKTAKAQLIKRRPLPDYLHFIHGDEQYHLGFDFSYIRNLSRTQTEKVVDMSCLKVIESILLCMLDVLGGQPGFTPQGSHKLLREYSLLYIRLFEKILAQYVLYFHIFKLAQNKILAFYVQTRVCLIILYETAAAEITLSQKYESLFHNIISLISMVYRMLFQGQKQIMNEHSYVTETFKMLKFTSNLERKINELTPLTQQLLQIDHHNSKITQILKEMLPLTKQFDLGGLQLQFLAQTECFIGWKYYSIPPIPYLPTKQSQKPYTLILSLSATLTYYDSKTRLVHFRPFMDPFIEEVSRLFELIVWSDQPKQTADLIVSSIQNNSKLFNYRLYSEHFSLNNGVLARDMTRLGRQTEKILFIRAKKENRSEREKKEKGVIEVNPFCGDMSDNHLLKVLSRIQWMTSGLPEDLHVREPVQFDTLQHIEEEVESNNTIQTHK